MKKLPEARNQTGNFTEQERRW